MTLADRLAQAEAEQLAAQQLRQRAIAAANDAGAALLRVEGQIALLKDLIAEATP